MKRAFVFIVTALMIFTLGGCAAILDGETLHVTHHPGTTVSQTPDSGVEAVDYESLKAAILSFVKDYETAGLISIYTYDGDVDSDVQKACDEIKNIEPIGVYALASLEGKTTKIVSYYEVELATSYKRTRAQMDSIVTASTLRYLKSEILNFIGDYASEAVIRTGISGITPESVEGFVRELYYQNPLSVVMMPGTAVEFFPPDGGDRIIELTFGNWVAADLLESYNDSLHRAASIMVKQATGENDAEILRSLCEMLMAACEYDEAGAVLIAEYGTQNFSATACGALVNGSAVGEGYAMAYKALCDELGIECTVVLGKLGDMLHAWNVVTLDGYYYHVDSSACDRIDFYAGFLKSDEQLAEAGYSWDKLATRICGGPFSEIKEEDPPENPDEEGEGEDPVEGEDGEGESTGEGEGENSNENAPVDGEIDETSNPEDGTETT